MLIFSMNGSKGKVLILNAFPLLDSNLVPRDFLARGRGYRYRHSDNANF